MSIEVIISIVIPVYNGEDYILRAVNSIIRPELEEIEIILVNDGSTDNSGQICEDLSKKYDKVKVIHKKNGGLSSARNCGIKNSIGRYISFLDADDYMDRNTYKKILNVIKKYSPDCVDFGWKYIKNNNEIIYNNHNLEKNVLLDKKIINTKILPPLLNLTPNKDNFIYDFACNKIFKKSIIIENNTFFDEGRRIWEDRPFLVHFLKYADNFYSMNDCFYNYVDVPNSLSRKYNPDFFKIILNNYELYCKWFKANYNFDTKYVNNYWSSSIENMIYRSLEQKSMKNQIYLNILDILSNSIVIDWFRKRDKDKKYKIKVDKYIINGETSKAIKVFKKVYKYKKFKESLSLAKVFHLLMRCYQKG